MRKTPWFDVLKYHLFHRRLPFAKLAINQLLSDVFSGSQGVEKNWGPVNTILMELLEAPDQSLAEFIWLLLLRETAQYNPENLKKVWLHCLSIASKEKRNDLEDLLLENWQTIEFHKNQDLILAVVGKEKLKKYLKDDDTLLNIIKIIKSIQKSKFIKPKHDAFEMAAHSVKMFLQAGNIRTLLCIETYQDFLKKCKKGFDEEKKALDEKRNELIELSRKQQDKYWRERYYAEMEVFYINDRT